MFIPIIGTDRQEGVRSNWQPVPLIDKQQVIDAIDALNGCDRTLVELSISDDTYLYTDTEMVGDGDDTYIDIGGGNDGRYIVTRNKDGIIFNLHNASAEPGRVDIVAAGQRGDYETKLCVDKSVALQTALYFYEYADFDRTLSWEILE